MRRKRNTSAGYTLASITRGAKFRRETARTYLINAICRGAEFAAYLRILKDFHPSGVNVADFTLSTQIKFLITPGEVMALIAAAEKRQMLTARSGKLTISAA